MVNQGIGEEAHKESLTRQSQPQRCNHGYGRSYRLVLAERSSMIAPRSPRTRERREC